MFAVPSLSTVVGGPDPSVGPGYSEPRCIDRLAELELMGLNLARRVGHGVGVGGARVASDHPGVVVRRVRRGPDAWVLAVSGELSQRSAGQVSGAVSAALANSGRVLVDVSGLREVPPVSWRLLILVQWGREGASDGASKQVAAGVS